jgi:glutamine amidotransferase
MCELFAMSSLFPTAVSSSLRELAQHGGTTGVHQDGWGLAFYDNNDVQLMREVGAASHSHYLQFIRDRGFLSSLVIGHLRFATQGKIALKNTQPFYRELGGRGHVFAHNGDLKGIQFSAVTQTGTFRPIGETDSEQAFCFLMNFMRDIWMSETAPTLTERIEIVSEFASIIRKFGPANFIYSDGEFLFVHSHKRKQKGRQGFFPPGLYTLTRNCVFEKQSTSQPAANLNYEEKMQSVFLVASIPLTQEAWIPLAEGTILAIANGKVAYGVELQYS